MKKQKINKQKIINIIKEKAESCYGEVLHLKYRGESKCALKVPTKYEDKSWKEYFERYFDIDILKNGEYILSIKLSYDSFVSILIDDIY